MRIAILTFDGFNELDSFIALGLLNRLGHAGWKAEICSPTTHVTSMNGVTIQAQRPLEFANEADAVIFVGDPQRGLAGGAHQGASFAHRRLRAGRGGDTGRRR